MKHLYFIAALLAASALFHQAHAAALSTLDGVRLIEDAANDGDSFLVEANGKRLHLRLYFVDCMETHPGGKTEVERIQEQQRHFGLPDARAVVRFGREARAYVQRALARPFTVYTSYAAAPGRSSRGRIYAFVRTPDGEYLSEQLVRAGLVRIHGKTRENPDGVPSNLRLQRLRDLQTGALLRRAGIWKESDPELLVASRAEQRARDREWRTVQKEISGLSDADGPLNLNCASGEQLQSIRGIGPVMAEKIIAARPYRALNDLLEVYGIGPATLEQIAPHLTVRPSC